MKLKLPALAGFLALFAAGCAHQEAHHAHSHTSPTAPAATAGDGFVTIFNGSWDGWRVN